MRYLAVIAWIILGILYYWLWNNSNSSCCGAKGISSTDNIESTIGAQDDKVLSAAEIAAKNKADEETERLKAEKMAADKIQADEKATKAIEDAAKTNAVTSVKSTDAAGKNKLTFYFPYNSSNSLYSSETEADLDDIVKSIKSSGKKVIISGHTDDRGNDESNKNLGKWRAEEVKKKLVSKGLKSSQIVTRSYGEEQPVASNATSSGRQKNRRVELIID
ncbi:OmpA family protein [Portibacter lacus]|uniref:OmpA-like domain-containing protein n=1 Tax=Portibacter lacus TaxID=1099794 RepID=A0AA37SXA0_9BACT|nr:OmpA family protein [Portibacter lacus]GLR19415.1 hypothetical protein GCM10007940_40310 [Portibacter lacus]